MSSRHGRRQRLPVGMSNSDHRDAEIARLRRTVALAKFYLGRFADSSSFVWSATEQAPQQFARDALLEIEAELSTRDEMDSDPRRFASGTSPIPGPLGGRPGFVEFHQALARQALDMGQTRAARAALRVLRTTDFAGGADVEGVLAVLRDSRSTDDEIAEAARRITHLTARRRDAVSE